MLYYQLKINRWPVLFSVIGMACLTFIGIVGAGVLQKWGLKFNANQIVSGLVTLGLVFLVGYPKEMYVTSKLRWNKSKYLIFPLVLILILPWLQGGYISERHTPSTLAYMFTVGFFEELFMHSLAMGVMILAWGESKKTILKAAIIGSLIFSFAHIVAIISNPVPSFILFKSTIAVGAFLISMGFAGLVYQLNSIWVAVVFHGAIDAILSWVGSPKILDMLDPNKWTLMLSFWAILYMLPWGVYGYWLLVKDFKKNDH